MLSRVASNLYWFGRYLQRAENTARLVSVHAHLLLDLPRNVQFGWAPLIQILGVEEEFASRHDEANEANVVRFLIADADNPGSIISAVNNAREILRTIRDAMPIDAWENLNDLHFFLQERSEKSLGRSKRFELLSRIIESTLLLDGILLSNMSHDVGFQFLRLGTNLEQADMTTRIVDVRSSSLIVPQDSERSGDELRPFATIQWMSVLRSLMAYQMYRRHERARVSGAAVLRFLMQNREFPRSVMFCLDSIGDTLPCLPPSRATERALQRTQALVRDANLDMLLDEGLHARIDEIQVGLGKLHEAISAAYFKA